MDAAAPDLSVIVVTYNGREMALRTLESARAHVGGLDVQWIVVDNGSRDGTPDAIEAAWPDIELVRAENRGFAAGNNRGLDLAAGRYVLLLNPDVEVAAGTFAELVAAMDRRPEIGIASVTQRWPDGRLQPSIRRLPTVRRQFLEALAVERLAVGGGEAVEDETRYATESPADWLVGAFLIVRREALAGVGGLDERFFLYSEEKDWCHRFGAAGWGVMHLPTMEIVHHCGGYARPELAAQLTYSKLLFARKHYRRSMRAGIRGALALRHAIRAALMTPVSLGRSELRARAAGERAALRVALGRSTPRLGADR